jgi:hypothetical protein
MEGLMPRNLAWVAERLGKTSVIHLKLEDGSKIRYHKRDGNAIWEHIWRARLRRENGVLRDPANCWDWFPAVREGRRWVVDERAFEQWYERFFRPKVA